MKRFYILIVVLILMSCEETTTTINYHPFLSDIINESDLGIRASKAKEVYDTLLKAQKIPFVYEDTVLFLYYGDAEKVNWHGDHNRWSQEKSVPSEGIRIEGTDLWYLKVQLDRDARIDYKVVLNGEEWILDPSSNFIQASGFGKNSELRMTDWQLDGITDYICDTHHEDRLIRQLMHSENMKYDVNYATSVPLDYDSTQTYALMIVLDGEEYIMPETGNLVNLVDFLTMENKIEPLILAFVSPIDPNKESGNRRMVEYALNEDYREFLLTEFLPEIQKTYPISDNPEDISLLGTSMGGLFTTYCLADSRGLIGNGGIQAPAYGYKPEIMDIVEQSVANPTHIYITTGTYFDALPLADEMKTKMINKNWSVDYMEVSEGHSWGAWKRQLDDILITFHGNVGIM